MAIRRTPHAPERAHATIRRMHLDDLDAVVALDAHVFGVSRLPYFARRLTGLDERDLACHTIGLVAEAGGAVVGFVMGTLTSGEFGFSEITILMDSIAVHPGWQRHGVGRQLADALIAEGVACGARDVYTLVNWNSWDMLKFFDSAGFGLAQTMLLSRHIGEGKWEQKEQP